MLNRKFLLTGVMMLGLSSIAFTADAADLVIDNQTNHDSTSIINKSSCSSNLPGGVTRAHTVNTVPERLLKTVCGNKDCLADIYMEDKCRGPIIASAVFNVKTGIKSISPPINGYGFRTNGPFSITITGGPAFAKK